MKLFKITEMHRPYLQVQCGDIAHLCVPGATYHNWDNAYNLRIEAVYQSMKPALPEKCSALLDVGGGCSGIGARLCEHYEGVPLVAVLDGKNTLAVVDKHREPFSNGTVTQNFLALNGVKNQLYYDVADTLDEINGACDLVISTQAWGFHFAPDLYIPKVTNALRPGGVLIADVRRFKPEWNTHLCVALGSTPRLLAEASKWVRLAWRKHVD